MLVVGEYEAEEYDCDKMFYDILSLIVPDFDPRDRMYVTIKLLPLEERVAMNGVNLWVDALKIATRTTVHNFKVRYDIEVQPITIVRSRRNRAHYGPQERAQITVRARLIRSFIPLNGINANNQTSVAGGGASTE